MIKDAEETDIRKPLKTNMKDVLIAAIELAKKGGEEVVKVRRRSTLIVQSKGKTKEGANDPVTEADYNSHCVMYYGLKKAFPKLKVYCPIIWKNLLLGLKHLYVNVNKPMYKLIPKY